MKKLFKATWIYLLVSVGAFFLFIPNAFAVEGLYVGGHVGYTALSGATSTAFKNTIGFGVDLGLQVNPGLDLLFQSQYSSHGSQITGINNLGLFSNTLDANVHIGQANDFDFTLQAGPGFYSFSSTSLSETRFGLNFGAGVDVIADEKLRVGIDWRYHLIFGSNASDYNYWSTMMRIGYWFGAN